MTLATWLTVVTICILGAMSPGPSLALVLKQTLTGGRRNGIMTALSHGIGVGIYAFLSILGLAAIMGALDDPDHLKQEVERNTEVRKYTMDFFRIHGYWVSDSQTNFMFTKTNMPAKDFREACAKHKVSVGRDFPPFEKTHARISIGTMEEMKRATEVFTEVLGISATDAGAGSN